MMVVAMLMATVCSVSAAGVFSGDSHFSVDVGESLEYVEEESDAAYYYFVKEDGITNFNINYSENTDNECLKNLTEDEINSYKTVFKTIFSAQFAQEFNEVNVEIKSVETKELASGYTALIIIIASELDGIKIYQKMYQIAGVENVYTLAYTAQTEEALSEVDAIAESFKMNEAEILESATDEDDGGSLVLTLVLCGAVLGATIGISLNIKKKQQRKREEELKAPLKSTFDTQQAKALQNEMNNEP